MREKINIVISCGDPAGIGTEIIIRSILRFHPPQLSFTLFGAPEPFMKLADKFDWAFRFLNFLKDGTVDFFPIPIRDNHKWGINNPRYGDVAFKAVSMAARYAKNGFADAIVTAPISKRAINLAGHKYSGHTEILSEIFGTKTTMMLFSGRLRISLVTTHLPIKNVPSNISSDSVVSHITRTNNALRDWFGIARPNIGVLALNPHAGEEGFLGHEENEIISAIETAQRNGINAVGPIVPDVAFLPAMRRKFDAYIAMYHDQGLIPLKTLGFHRGVNITLGLPIPRTSPDHGTAFDIAGKGLANPKSFLFALRTAYRFARKRK